MNLQLLRDLAAAFVAANDDEATKVIIFTGAGRAFCAGDDLNEHVHPENEAAARSHVRTIQLVSEAILFGDKPVIGAINGWAVGGGFEWAINCDFPIWAETCARLLSGTQMGHVRDRRRDLAAAGFGRTAERRAR